MNRTRFRDVWRPFRPARTPKSSSLVNAVVIGGSPKRSVSGNRFDESAEAIGFAKMFHRDYVAISIA
jgi:hypothetical protein